MLLCLGSRDDARGKSIYCSYRRPEYCFQHLSWETLITSVPGKSSAFGLQGTYTPVSTHPVLPIPTYLKVFKTKFALSTLSDVNLTKFPIAWLCLCKRNSRTEKLNFFPAGSRLLRTSLMKMI